MSDSIRDQKHVVEQYKNADSLNARVALHRDYSVNPQSWDDWLFEQIEFRPGMRVLDVGCGDGRLWAHWRDRLPQDIEITLSDFSEGMLAEAEKKLGSFAKYRQCDVQALPFGDGEFDAIMAFHMLYHVPDIKKAASEIKRTLRNGGVLYAATNGDNAMTEMRSIIHDFDSDINYPIVGKLMSFRLGNGEEWLKSSFSSIERRDFFDALHITSSRPLIDYYLSMGSFIDKTKIVERENKFVAYLDAIIEKEGFIHISKSAGLFIAS